MSILRHVLTWVIYSVSVTIIILGFTLIAFPLTDWSLLFEKKIFDFPFLGIVFIIPIVIGIIVGLTIGWHWRQRLHFIVRQLTQLVKGEKIQIKEDRYSYKELKQIEESMQQIEEKFLKQADVSQRIATDRANEREKSLQEVVSEERNRLARELHDSVSQQLFAASMLMSAINENESPKDESFKKQLALVENMINQSQLEMRALLLHLRPVALKGKSLQEGAEEFLVELIQKVPMEITWKIEDFSVAKGIEDQLFRILQESVSNTLRHADASMLNVMIIDRDNMIIMRVIDDGEGFDVDNVTGASSYGLENMKERSEEVGGTFKLISLPKEGTRIEVKVPKLKEEGVTDD